MSDQDSNPKQTGGTVKPVCIYCGKEVDGVVKQLIRRRDGTSQAFCDQGCRNEYESDAEEFYRKVKP